MRLNIAAWPLNRVWCRLAQRCRPLINARLCGLFLSLVLGLTVMPANAWFWQAPTWSSINAELSTDYPTVTHISTQDLERRLVDHARAKPLVIDARAQNEFAISHISGAVHAETVEQVRALLDKQAPGTEVVVYCSVGVRSARLVAQLQEAGIERAVNLKGSIFEWANRGLPVYKGNQAAVGVHPFNARWGELLDRRHWSHEP